MTDLVMTPALWADIKMLLTTTLPVLMQSLGKDRTNAEEPADLDSSLAMQAVGVAVHKAHEDLVNQLHVDGIDLEEDTRQALFEFLDKPDLTEEIAKKLLFGEIPDFEKLQAAYSGPEWDAFTVPLDVFFESIENYLLKDEHLYWSSGNATPDLSCYLHPAAGTF